MMGWGHFFLLLDDSGGGMGGWEEGRRGVMKFTSFAN